MISTDDAYQRLSILAQQQRGYPSHWCETTKAAEQYLAEVQLAKFDHPQFDQSAMDGFAFKFDEQLSSYLCVGTVAAGDVPNQVSVGPGQCVRIMTGAPVPIGLNTVVMVEQAVLDGDHVSMPSNTQVGQHVRCQGSNIQAGAECLAAHTRITAAAMASLLAQGISMVPVAGRCRVGVAATGSEICPPHWPLPDGAIYNSNGPVVTSLLQPWSDVVDLGVVRDDPVQLTKALKRMTQFDVLVLSGGVSAGDFDYVPACAQEAGFKEVFHKIRMKPGKPMWLGAHQDGRVLFGLPGNPLSAWVGTTLFIAPFVRRWLTGSFQRPQWLRLPISSARQNRGDRVCFLGATLTGDPLVANPVTTTGSGDLVGFSQTQTLLRIDAHCELKAGDEVDVMWPF